LPKEDSKKDSNLFDSDINKTQKNTNTLKYLPDTQYHAQN